MSSQSNKSDNKGKISEGKERWYIQSTQGENLNYMSNRTDEQLKVTSLHHCQKHAANSAVKRVMCCLKYSKLQEPVTN